MWLGSIWFQELSPRTDMMVDSLLHAQWRGSQCLLPCMAACLDADGWPSNKPNYFWFCMKLISMQGCWFAVCISNGFFFLFSFFLFLFSLLLAMNTPHQMSIIFQVSVTCADLKGYSLRSGGKLPRQVSSCFPLDTMRSGLHSLCWKKAFIVAKVTNFPLQRLHCIGRLKGRFLNESDIKSGCLYC